MYHRQITESFSIPHESKINPQNILHSQSSHPIEEQKEEPQSPLYGVCRAPHHESRPIIALCDQYCGYHQSQLLCQLCLVQCQRKEFAIKLVSPTVTRVRENQLTCRTSYHSEEKIIGVCMTQGCPYHHQELICQKCATQCPNKEYIRYFRDEINKYNNATLDDESKAQAVEKINDVCNRAEQIVKQIRLKKKTLIDQIKGQHLNPNDLKQEDVDQLVQFMHNPLQQTLGQQVRELQLDLEVIQKCVTLIEEFISERTQFQYKMQQEPYILVKKPKLEVQEPQEPNGEINNNEHPIVIQSAEQVIAIKSTKEEYKQENKEEKYESKKQKTRRQLINESLVEGLHPHQFRSEHVKIVQLIEEQLFNQGKSIEDFNYRQNMRQLRGFLKRDPQCLILEKIRMNQFSLNQAALLKSMDWALPVKQDERVKVVGSIKCPQCNENTCYLQKVTPEVANKRYYKCSRCSHIELIEYQ